MLNGITLPWLERESGEDELMWKGSFYNICHEGGVVHASGCLHEMVHDPRFMISVALLHVRTDSFINHRGRSRYIGLMLISTQGAWNSSWALDWLEFLWSTLWPPRVDLLSWPRIGGRMSSWKEKRVWIDWPPPIGSKPPRPVVRCSHWMVSIRWWTMGSLSTRFDEEETALVSRFACCEGHCMDLDEEDGRTLRWGPNY